MQYIYHLHETWNVLPSPSFVENVLKLEAISIAKSLQVNHGENCHITYIKLLLAGLWPGYEMLLFGFWVKNMSSPNLGDVSSFDRQWLGLKGHQYLEVVTNIKQWHHGQVVTILHKPARVPKKSSSLKNLNNKEKKLFQKLWAWFYSFHFIVWLKPGLKNKQTMERWAEQLTHAFFSISNGSFLDL